MQSCYNSWKEAGPCDAVSRLYISVIIIYISIISLHSWIWCNVCDYITTGFDAKIVDPDDGVYSSCLRALFANQVSPIPSVFPLKGWTSSLQQLPSFICGCLYTHGFKTTPTVWLKNEDASVHPLFLFSWGVVEAADVEEAIQQERQLMFYRDVLSCILKSSC